MKAIGIIPERMRSSRFYGKPLAKINGKTMVQHVYENVEKCNDLDAVLVATGDAEIIECVKGFGGEIVITRDDHYRATNQVAEGLMKYKRTNRERFGVVCMIQGDEPMVHPKMVIDSLLPIICKDEVQITNLMFPLDEEGFKDPNELKVVVDEHNYALYFSRATIPSDAHNTNIDVKDYMQKQVCIFGFTNNALVSFPKLKETYLEKVESIDMLRFLGHGYKILMIPTEYETYSVDTPKDLEYVEKLLRLEKFLKNFKGETCLK